MKNILLVLLGLILALGFTACTPKESPETAAKKTDAATQETRIVISAAASLTDALLEMQPDFEQATNSKLTFNFGASGTLQKQIEEGAPCDVFLSAAEKQMNELEEKNFILKESRIKLLQNRLVLIVAGEEKDQIHSLQDLVDLDVNLSIGTPESVPVGQYSKESLENLGLWSKLEGKMILAKDVRQVLTYVDTGEVAAGIVYGSDATQLKSGVVKEIIDNNTHKKIIYPAAVVASTQNPEISQRFLDYLSSEKAKKIFEKYGFEIYTE